jgi:endoplasmic reticulum protein 29
MKRIIEKGDSLISTEQERVDKLLTGKLSDNKKRDLSNRLNILDSFKFGADKEGKDEL